MTAALIFSACVAWLITLVALTTWAIGRGQVRELEARVRRLQIGNALLLDENADYQRLASNLGREMRERSVN